MQIFVKCLTGKTLALDVDERDSIARVKKRIEDLEGLSVEGHMLLCGGRRLIDRRTIDEENVRKECTLDLVAALCGGVRMKVKMMTSHLPCGTEVLIDVDSADTLREVKEKLEAATGVPKRSQKVFLAGIGEIMMGDKRTNIKFSKCGTANNMSLATMGHEEK